MKTQRAKQEDVPTKLQRVKLIPPQLQKEELVLRVERLVKEENFSFLWNTDKEFEDILKLKGKEIRERFEESYDSFSSLKKTFSIENYKVGDPQIVTFPYEIKRKTNETEEWIEVHDLRNKRMQYLEKIISQFDGFSGERGLSFLPVLTGKPLPAIVQLFEEHSKEENKYTSDENILKLFADYKIEGEPYAIQNYAVPVTITRKINFESGLEIKVDIGGGLICDAYWGSVLDGRITNISILNFFEKKREEKKTAHTAHSGFKKALLTLIACSVFGTGYFIYKEIQQHHKNPEYLKEKELEKKFLYIIPAGSEKKVYQLSDGDDVEVYHNDPFLDGHWLEVTLNNETKFLSEHFGGFSNGDNARVLDKLKVRTANGWEVIPKEKIKDYNSWQKMYEDLIQKIAESKFEFERNAEQNVESRLYNYK